MQTLCTMGMIGSYTFQPLWVSDDVYNGPQLLNSFMNEFIKGGTLRRLDHIFHFISTLSYCNLVWGNCGKTLSDRLQKLQNRAARVLTFSSYDTDAKGLIRQLGWKDLCTQRQIQKALMVYKSLNGLVPEYLSSKFLKRSGMPYSLRDSENKLVVPNPRTNYMKNSFSYSGATLWNSLPCNLRMIKSYNQFKSKVRHGIHGKQD